MQLYDRLVSVAKVEDLWVDGGGRFLGLGNVVEVHPCAPGIIARVVRRRGLATSLPRLAELPQVV